MPIFGRKCQFWPNLAVFGQKSNFLGRVSKTFGTLISESNETPFLCRKHWAVGLQLAARGKNVLFWPKNLDTWGQKSIILGDNYLGKGNFFLRTYFPSRGQNMVRVQKCMVFFWPKIWFWAKKSEFCHTTPILVNDPFIALGVMVHFLPWDRFFDFQFRGCSCFRKKIQLTAQKVFPLPTVGALSASNSPRAG